MARELPITHQELVKLLETDRLQTLVVISGEVLRRVKEPLGMIRGRAETLKSQLDFYQRENAQGILDQVFHLENLISSIEKVIAPTTPAAPRASLAPCGLVEDVIHFFQPRLELGKIQVMNLLPPTLLLPAADDGLKQILVPVFLNAVEALESQGDSGGGVAETANRVLFIQHQCAKGQDMISIEDNGPGVGPEELQTLFQPLATTKNGHVGLSLAICKKIAEERGWTLKAFSQKGRGTRIELWMPQSA